MTTSGSLSLPTSDEEWHRLIQDIQDRRSNSYVQAALMLAHRFLKDEQDKKLLTDALTSVQARCTELLEDRRTLSRIVERLAVTDPDGRDAVVAELLTATRAMM